MNGPGSPTAPRARTLLPQRLMAREGLLAAAAYGVVLAVAYSSVVFSGSSLVYSDNLNQIEPYGPTRTHGRPNTQPAGTEAEGNLSPTANLQDPGATWAQWETGGAFLRRTLGQGELPFWDPYTGGGVPAMTNLTQAFFFPPYLLLIALGNGVLLKNVYFLGLLLMAAVCTWTLLRRAGLSWSASFVGGLTFLLSGGLTQTAGSFIGQTACCLPVGLVATQWFLRRASWPAAAGLALVFASISLASFPPLLFAVFGLSASYACAELLSGSGCTASTVPRRVAAIQFVSACMLGMGMVAFYYLPAFSLMSVTPHVTSFYRDASSQTILRARDLLQLLAPALMGGVPVWVNDPIPRISAGAFHYLGAVPLLLVGVAPFRRLRQPLWLVAIAGSVVVVGIMLGVVPFAQLRRLPLLHNIHFGNYYGIVFDFLLALLAAAGFEHLREDRVAGLRGWAAVSVLLAGLLALLLAAFRLNVVSHPAYADWLERYTVLVVIALAGATATIVATGGTARRYVRYGAWALVALLLVEGAFNSRFPRQARWDVWAHPPPYVEYLQRETGLGRVFTIGGALYADAGSAFKIIQLDSLMTFNPPRIFELYRRYVNPSAYLFLRDAVSVPPEPVLDAAGVSHLAMPARTPPATEVVARGHELVFADSFTAIFRRSAPPRYFFTTEFQVSAEHEALEAVGTPRAPAEIIVERQPPFISRPNVPTSAAPVTVDRFSNNYVRLSLVAPRTGFVYASDSFFSGWSATVNRRAVPIEPANYAFRAVQVPPGPVTIELRYVPPGLWPGLGVSALAVMIVAGLIGTGARTSRRRLVAFRGAEVPSK